MGAGYEFNETSRGGGVGHGGGRPMRVRLLTIKNFRGVRHGEVQFEQHTLLVGGNNVGKSTVCEALDLVLGPERLYRRPVVDEHDFYRGQYLNDDGSGVEIQVEAVLVGLSDEQRRRFGMSYLRRWDEAVGEFVDEQPGGLARADEPTVTWALPVMFIGRYEPEEDDFVGDTFFSHPLPDPETLDEAERAALGAGRSRFTREHKRLCGFVFLRTLRTGSRALSLQRGSLLDTILRLAPEGSAQMWQDTLEALRMLDPAIGEIDKLKDMRAKIRDNMGRFVNLKGGDDATAFFASDLTREHLREVVRLFVATKPSEYPVPFARQGTGSINMLVFALLSIIAELKGQQNVIFAMEEPEIALPPHTQRRVTKFVLHEMGQSIVT
ncbi:AAA family ATPase, partial [Actinotalea sp. AC32]|nr:AAA family ATPase [Actinotalea sp. AC32]